MFFLAELPLHNEWPTIIFSTVTALVTVLSSFWFSKKKQKTDDFAAFMEESSDFREEIRKELKRKEEEYKEELEKYKVIILDLKSELATAKKDADTYIAQYKNITDLMPQIVWTLRTDGEIDYANHRWFEYMGIPFELARSDQWQGIIHPDDFEKAMVEFKTGIKKGITFEYLTRFKRSDGTYHWFLVRAVPRYDNYGRIQQWIGTSTDINSIFNPETLKGK